MANAESTHPTFASDAIPSDVKNAVFLNNPIMDNLVSCMIAMGTEVWATKRRMKVLEALLSKKGVTPDMIETYEPTAEEKADWEKDRDRFIDLTLGSFGNAGFRSFAADFPKRG
jgi:hypothetical protein